MKTGALIALTAIITSLLWLIVLRESYYDQLRDFEKNVWMPTTVILSDLKATAGGGDPALLNRKIDLLSERWKRYTEGGAPPLVFGDEIIRLKPEDLKERK